MNKKAIGTLGWLLGGVAVLLCASALQFPAFGDEILFSNTLNTANGNCAFQCGGIGNGVIRTDVFAADNFILARNSTIERIDFTGIRTGSPPDRNFTTTVDVEIFNFDRSWTNSFTSQPFGSLIASYAGLTATQNGVSFPVGPSQAFISFKVDLPKVDHDEQSLSAKGEHGDSGSLSLDRGRYWLALHADVSGWSGKVGNGDDTSLYWAFGFGDGIWAWNLFSPPGEWSNPNPAFSPTQAGWAFDVRGTSVPEPATWLLLGSGLAGMILWRKRTA